METDADGGQRTPRFYAGRVRHVVFPKGSWRERVAWRAKLRVIAGWYALRRTLRGGRRAGAALPAVTDVGFGGRHDGRVTVVLPVYGQADLLPHAIESVLAQTFREFELIVLDDGSKDDIDPVLARHVVDPRVRVLRQPNQKLPKALSNAFEFATGELWCWTSADNLMEPTQLERQVAFLREHADTTMVYCDYLAIDDRGAPLVDPSFRPHNRRAPTSPAIHVQRTTRDLNTIKDNFVGPCFLYRGTAGRALGEYDPRLGLEDYDYWMRMNHHFRIEHLGTDDLLYRYRVHDNSLSARADELGIHSAANELMGYERRRAEDHRRPLPVFVDAGADLGEPGPLPPPVDHVDATTSEPDGPALIVTTPPRLDAIASRGLSEDTAVVAVCDGDPRETFRHRMALRRHADHCIAIDRDHGEFLAALHPSVFIAPAIAPAIAVARAAWRNDRFYRRERSAQLRTRVLPRPYLGPRPLRVLLQVDRIGAGGLEHVVVMLAKTLMASGAADPLLLIVDEPPSADAVALLEGIRWIDASGERDRAARYREILCDEDISVVNAHYSTFGADLAAGLGVPFVQTVHNTYVWLDASQRERIAQADPHTAAYLCVSDRVAYYGWRRLGLDPRKLLVQINATRPMREPARRRAEVMAELGLRSERFTFLNVASIYAAKAQLVLVEALGELAARGTPAQIVLIGSTMDVAYRSELGRRAARLGIADAIRFVPHTDEIESFYAAADAFVLPSYWEGWSLAANEAAWHGLPMILARVGAAEEMAELTGAVLVDPPFSEVDELSAATLVSWTAAPAAEQVRRWADAMAAVVAEPTPTHRDRLRAFSAPDAVFADYASILGWIVQRGDAAAARPWTFQPWRRSGGPVMRAFARSVVDA